MSAFREKYGPWAMITGASSGIGAEFARQLAARGLNLVLVARRLNRLEQLAKQLAGEHGCDVRSIECDLGSATLLDILRPQLAGLDVGLLVNNAGFANTGSLVDNDLERELQLLNVNCRAYLVLAHHLGGRLRTRGRGGIIFVSSMTAFAPAALWANYSASKAYELALGEAMYAELRPKGVDVLVVCPGPVRTGLYEAADADLSRASATSRSIAVEPSAVVTTALEHLGRKRSVVVGWKNRLFMQLGRALPRAFVSGKLSAFVASVRRERPGPHGLSS